jgi:geranylgeranyl pyrophosphate synthase
MKYETWQNEITKNLQTNLTNISPNHNFTDVLKYSVFPTGKLFRPLLVYSLAKDHGEITNNHKRLAESIEIHHTYTLIHDDLPSMDDDDYRRGRESSHVKFSEWQAVLAGDALLNSSYELLSDISHSQFNQLFKTYTSYTGQRGLILGQVFDLGNETDTLEKILHLHELKTARLIQLSLKGSAILSDSKFDLDIFDKIGKCLGINFQLLDDLCELTEPLNKHEVEINPFLKYETSTILNVIKKNHLEMTGLINDNGFKNLHEYVELYLSIIKKKLNKGIIEINKHIEFKTSDLSEIC